MVFWKILMGLAGVVAMAMPASAQTVREAVDALREQAADERTAFEYELVGEAIETVPGDLGALEDPPGRDALIALIDREWDERISLLESDGPGPALELIVGVLPPLVPVIEPDRQQVWVDRYIALAEPVATRDYMDWHDVPPFSRQLRAAGAEAAADQVAAAHVAWLELVIESTEPDTRGEAIAVAYEEALNLEHDAAIGRFRALLITEAVTTGVWKSDEPALSWDGGWDFEARTLARDLLDSLPDRLLSHAFDAWGDNPRDIIETRLSVLTGERSASMVIEAYLSGHWDLRDDHFREARDMLSAFVRDRAASGEIEAATELLISYQNVPLAEASPRLAELWFALEDCPRAKAAARLTMHRIDEPAMEGVRLDSGDEGVRSAHEDSVITHADVSRSQAMRRPGGIRARIATVLLECGAAREALDVQAGQSMRMLPVSLAQIEIDLLALWQTLQAPASRADMEAAIWNRWPMPTYEFERSLIPLIALMPHRRATDHRRLDELILMTLMVRGMPERARDIWAPIYRAVVWRDAQAELTLDRLVILAHLAATMPD
ncbi:hypothetical protein AWH62_02415 [Maricaulis sp. W15]|nr:hypothetical protein AWH62_02415 [Maricaulis sp. W15]